MFFFFENHIFLMLCCEQEKKLSDFGIGWSSNSFFFFFLLANWHYVHEVWILSLFLFFKCISFLFIEHIFFMLIDIRRARWN